ncbi:MAG: M20/M25/M40 family metallo-hydrolase, partial [Chloroflexota bacterium]
EGITIREDGAGGGSDGNFTAAMGIPTLDGMGAEGGGLHALHEHILVNSLPKKAALMAAILRDWE